MSKFKAALTAGLLFFVISSPALYKLVDSLVGGVVGSVAPGLMHIFRIAESGCPTTYGLVVHSVVFAAVVYYLMK
jgi:hypothetical protein